MNIFLKVGQWLEARFPEKLTPTQVSEMVDRKFQLTKEICESFSIDIKFLRDDVKKLQSDIETLKTNMTMKTRIAGSSPASLTPFAQRLQPVQPANSSGGVPIGHK